MALENFTKETFWSLLSRPDIQYLTIPIIQRSYTQGGRTIGSQTDIDVEKKGERFIMRLCTILLNAESVELDFIYTSSKGRSIYPLDGQQRLTTLFLLHWYIAQKEGKLTDEVKKTLQKFTYETRASSRYFCEKLSCFTMQDIYKDTARETITNQHWFLMSWLNDPSISSMLGMLGKIDCALKSEKKELWDKITLPPAAAPITFFYTPLEDFDLTDDLYIKMNARGKELTGFENTKAEFNKKIDDENWDTDKNQDETFGHRIDTKWTDLFWRFHNKKHEIDGYILRFISAVLVNHYALKNERDIVQILYAHPLDVSPEHLEHDAYQYLYTCFDLFCRDEISDSSAELFNIVFWLRNQKKEFKSLYQFFELFISKTNNDGDEMLTWQERVIFYGVCLYLHQNSTINITNFIDWLVFIRNLVSNGTVDSYETFRSALNRLTELKNGTKDIYAWLLKQPESIVKGFSERQMSEEIKKAVIYHNTPLAKKFFRELENHNFCRGRLEFVFYCLDITDSVSDINALEVLKARIFETIQDNISNEFKRAMFTITDFWFYRSFCYFLKENKYCIIFDIEQLKTKYAFSDDNRQHLKALLLHLFSYSLKDVIKNFKKPDDMSDWKWRLITEPRWLDKCSSNHITIGVDYQHCYLLKAQRPSMDDQCILVK